MKMDRVVDGLITEWTYGFEDYPCDSTRKRWFAEFSPSIMQITNWRCKNGIR